MALAYPSLGRLSLREKSMTALLRRSSMHASKSSGHGAAQQCKVAEGGTCNQHIENLPSPFPRYSLPARRISAGLSLDLHSIFHAPLSRTTQDSGTPHSHKDQHKIGTRLSNRLTNNAVFDDCACAIYIEAQVSIPTPYTSPQ